MFTCEFCNKELSTKTTLKTHQEKAKYCLEKQKKEIKLEFICEYCNKGYGHKHRKETHILSCPMKIEKEKILTNDELKAEILLLKNINRELKEEIESLKIDKEKEKTEIYSSLFSKDQKFILDQNSRLIEKSSTITNTNNTIKGKTITMNSLNLSQERLLAIKDTYTIKDYEKGGSGQADWVVENVLKDELGNIIYKCTDKNRKNFVYRDDKGNTINDIHAKKLKEAILPLMETKLREYKRIKFSELAEVDDDDSELMEKCNDLYNENRELGSEFDKRLVEKTY